MTGSGKTSRQQIFTKNTIYMNKLLNSQSKSARLEWSVFAGCFPKHSDDPYEWSGALASLGMAICGCTALWY